MPNNTEDCAKKLIDERLGLTRNMDIPILDTTSIRNLDYPYINFRLSSFSSNRVYNKYKLLSRPKGLLSGLLNDCYDILNINSPLRKTIPFEGVIAPDSEKFQNIVPPTNDPSFLLEFVNLNIHDIDDIKKWINKYGALRNYCFDPDGCQPVPDFVDEFYSLITLYQLFRAINEYDNGYKSLLEKRVKLMKLSEHLQAWETQANCSTYKYWGQKPLQVLKDKSEWNGSSPTPKFLEDIEKAKSKKGYILLIDGEPTNSYFSTNNITDEKLLTQVMRNVTNIISSKTNGNYIIDLFEIEPNANNALSKFRVIPTIKCMNIVTLLYFQLLWIISSNGAKQCKKCGQYFIPGGIRPGKQIYCGLCGKHPSQDKYKKRVSMGIKDYKNGLSLEDAAKSHNIKASTLEKAIMKRDVDHAIKD